MSVENIPPTSKRKRQRKKKKNPPPASYLLEEEGKVVLFLGHKVEILLVAVGRVQQLLLLQVQVFLADGDLFVQPHSLQLQLET